MLIDRFGDYRCRQSAIKDIEMAIYGGGLIGVIASLFLMAYITERQLLVVTLIANLAGLTVTLGSINIPMASVGLTINFGARFMQLGCIFPFLSQSVGESIRVHRLTLTNISFMLGALLMAGAYWVIQPWELAMVLCQIIPLLGCLLCMLLWVEDVPMSLITSRSALEAFKGFQNIAKFNKIDCDLT